MSSPLTSELVLAQLRGVKYPGYSRDIVSFGMVKDVQIDGTRVSVRIAVTTADAGQSQTNRGNGRRRHRIDSRRQRSDRPARRQRAGEQGAAGRGRRASANQKSTGIKHIIAVASGKGGVGKSTVAANLAIALRGEKNQARVGLCDCDIYGPSIGLMFGTNERPTATEEGRIQPIRRYDLNLMSMGFLLDDSAPAILRGPMVTRYTQQFLRSVDWGELDYLVLDLPPGTGDIQLTIVQTVALSGAVIVTTPQEVALIDARKAATMFTKVNVPILGLVENMSYFLCPNDGNRYKHLRFRRRRTRSGPLGRTLAGPNSAGDGFAGIGRPGASLYLFGARQPHGTPLLSKLRKSFATMCCIVAKLRRFVVDL
jgi:ATP-binding protein involved in chromosome partitioning